MNTSAVDFQYLLLDYYKDLGLDEKELAVLLMVDHLLKGGNSLVTADLLSLKMTLTSEEADRVLVGLIRKKYIEYDTSTTPMRTSLSPLRAALLARFKADLSAERSSLNKMERNKTLSALTAYFEKRLSRPLSPAELDAFGAWLDDGYSESEIEDALEDLLASGKRASIKGVDRLLRSPSAKQDARKQAASAQEKKWQKDNEDLQRILATKWVDDGDD